MVLIVDLAYGHPCHAQPFCWIASNSTINKCIVVAVDGRILGMFVIGRVAKCLHRTKFDWLNDPLDPPMSLFVTVNPNIYR